MSEDSGIRSTNMFDSEVRLVLGPSGNKAQTLIESKKPILKPLKKAEKSKEKVVAVEDKNGVLLPIVHAKSSPLSHSVSVPSILRRHESLLGSNLSLNASCSSDASTDSFQSRASTGRMCRTSSKASGKKHLAFKTSNGVVPNGVPESLPERLQPKRRCGWAAATTVSFGTTILFVQFNINSGLYVGNPMSPSFSNVLTMSSVNSYTFTFNGSSNTISDPSYVAFHDEEWGVPAHDDKKLFEFLVLSLALAELTWPAILSKRRIFREVFADFDPIAIAKLSEKKIIAAGSLASSLLSELKLRSVIENARQVSKVIDEFGSFDKYIWSFVNNKPIVSSFRYPRQVPVKTPKADLISKDLVRRGFRSVGPTVVYSFLQVAGLTNDHLMSCFRFHDCCKIEVEGRAIESKSEEKKANSEIESEICRSMDELI